MQSAKVHRIEEFATYRALCERTNINMTARSPVDLALICTMLSGVNCAQSLGMPAVRRYQELRAWQLCVELSDVVYRITDKGPSAKDLECRDQIRAAAEAAAPLIAEGFIRFTPDEFVRYLRMARGEIAEVQTKLESGRRKRYFPDDQQTRAESISRHAMAVTTLLLKSKLPLIKRKKKGARRTSR